MLEKGTGAAVYRYRRHHSSQDVMHWNLITASLLIAVMWNEEAVSPPNFIKPGDTEAIEK